jgi:diguanylate cyclase (GGDEF)-like protein
MLSQLRGQSQIFVTKVEAEQVRLEARRAGERAARAETSARVDQLTGLGNRRELELRWPPLMQQLQGQQLPLALVMADLDHFKQVNDRYGHAVGDAVLVTLAKLLRDNTREQDMIIRVGGEEFLLVLPEADATRALEICERLRQRVAAHGWELVAPGLQISLSIGLASAPPYELRSLIERADEALYAAKRAGRNAVRLAPSTS